jgi:hypothetical protein
VLLHWRYPEDRQCTHMHIKRRPQGPVQNRPGVQELTNHFIQPGGPKGEGERGRDWGGGGGGGNELEQIPHDGMIRWLPRSMHTAVGTLKPDAIMLLVAEARKVAFF